MSYTVHAVPIQVELTSEKPPQCARQNPQTLAPHVDWRVRGNAKQSRAGCALMQLSPAAQPFAMALPMLGRVRFPPRGSLFFRKFRSAISRLLCGLTRATMPTISSFRICGM